MPLDLPAAVSQFETFATARSVDDEQPTETIESVDHHEVPRHRGPARGILIGVMIGSGAWVMIFAAVAFARPIFFG